MADLVQRLNTLLNKTDQLYRETTTYPNDCELINILIQLVNSNHLFTTAQVNKFIIRACYPNGKPNFISSDIIEHINIIKYIFTDYNISEEHIIKICKDRYVSAYGRYSAIDCLFERKYDFTMTCYEYLCKNNYKYFDMQDYNTFHTNVIFIGLTAIVRDRNDVFKICEKLITQNNNPFDIKHLELLYIFLKTQSFKDPGKEKILVLLNTILSKCKDNNEIIQFIINLKLGEGRREMDELMIVDYALDKFEHSDILTKYILENLVINKPDYLFKLKKKGYVVTAEDINRIYEDMDKFYTSNPISDSYSSLIPEKKLIPRKKYKTDTSIPVFELFKILKVQPNINTLNIACKKDSTDDITTIIENYGIIPEKTTLDMCMNRLNYDIISKLLKYKLTPDDETFYKIYNRWGDDHRNESYTQIIELLIIHGLNINITHIKYLIKEKICLHNLERFGISYNEELYFVCYINNYFPTEYTSKCSINPILLQMYDLCKSKKLRYEKLIEFMKTKNIKLDRFALDYLIEFNPDVSRDIMMDYKCMPSIITGFKRCKIPDKLLEGIIEQHNISEKEMFEQYDMKFD